MANEDYGFCGFDGMQNVCKALKIKSDTVYKKLSTVKSVEKQLTYLFSLFDTAVLEGGFKNGKSSLVAYLLRQKGNLYYKKRDFKTALDYYSMSLSMAPGNCTEMPMAIGNKSACYSDLELPRAVCTHVRLVETNMMDIYPEKSRKKLKERIMNVISKLVPSHVPEHIRQACISNYFDVSGWEWERSSPFISQPILDFVPMSSEIFTQRAASLALGSNPKAPGLSAAVKIEYNETLGRHIVAARQINAGDLIMRANINAVALYSDKHEFSHCSYCLRFSHCLIPCFDCSHERYCNMTCLDLARKDYHWALCPVGGALNFGTHAAHTKLVLAIRLLLSHISLNRGKMYEFLKEVSKFDSELSDCKIKGFNKKGNFDPGNFRTVYYMWSDPSLLPEEMRQSLVISCAYAMQVITEECRDFFSMERNLNKSKKEELKKELSSLLYRVRVGLEWNCFEMFEHLSYVARKREKCKPFVLKTQVRSIGLYFHSLLGLFNHACYSNCVYSENINGTILVRALKTVNVGDQLTIPYFDYWATPRERRASLYRFMGGFQCGCFACSHGLDSKSVFGLRDLHLSPRCSRCHERKSARPDQEVVNCSKCKSSLRLETIRDKLLMHMIIMAHYRVHLPVSDIPGLTEIFAHIEQVEEMALPHSCLEVNRLRRAVLDQIVAGDKCYVRPVMICEPKRDVGLDEELAAIPAHVWETC